MKVNLTATLAVWGAFLSSVTFGWNMLRDLRDRPAVKLSAQLGRPVQDAVGHTYFLRAREIEVPGKIQLLLTITNIGRRRVHVLGWGGKYKRPLKPSEKPSFVVIPHSLPQMLEEGQFASEFSDEPLVILDERVKSISVWDSTGKDWDLPKRELRRLRSEARELAANGKLL